MRIDLNGQGLTTKATTLQALLDEQGFDSASIATALNGVFVARTARASTPLTEGSRVEALSPMQGG